MIGYVTVGSNDVPKAAAFFDALFAELGAGRFMEEEGVFVAWAADPQKAGLAVTKPFDGKEATVGNGAMTAFQVDSKEAVDKVYAKAISLGGTCEGGPGDRSEGFYAAYFRDLDGNKFNVFYAPSM